MSRECAARFWQKEAAAARRTGPTLEHGSKTKAGKKRKWKGINEGDWQESVGRAGAWFTCAHRQGRRTLGAACRFALHGAVRLARRGFRLRRRHKERRLGPAAGQALVFSVSEMIPSAT